MVVRMGASDIIDVWGAPDADAIAQLLRGPLGAKQQRVERAPAWGGYEWWFVQDQPRWRVSVEPVNLPHDDDGQHRVVIEYGFARDMSETEWVAAFHGLTDRVFEVLRDATGWGLWATADDEREYPHRYRPTDGVEQPRGSGPPHPA
jgi:hypothetical protein